MIDGDLFIEWLICGKDEYSTMEREFRDSFGDAFAAEYLDIVLVCVELCKDKGNVVFKDGNYF